MAKIKAPLLPLDREFKTGPRGVSAKEYARWYRDEMVAHWKALDLDALARIAKVIEEARTHGRQVFVMGNGGSAATASHMATDLSKTAFVEGKPLLRCLSLTDNMPFLTAIGNDLGFDQVFVRQMENLLAPNDVVILVSGSGNSPNVINAARYAKAKGAFTIGLLGFNGGKLLGEVDIALVVASYQYGVIEDIHMSIGHILTFYLRQSK